MSLLLICFLALSLSLPVSPVAAQSGHSQSELEVQNVKGIVKGSKFEDVDSSANLQNLQLSQKDGSAKIQGKLTYKGHTFDLSLTGKLYPVTGKGTYNKKLVLGDFQESKDFNVLQLRIEKQSKETALLKENRNMKGKTVLSLVLEHKKSGENVFLKKPFLNKSLLPSLVVPKSKSKVAKWMEKGIQKEISPQKKPFPLRILTKYMSPKMSFCVC